MTDTALLTRLEAVMPSSVAEFYHLLRDLYPSLWADLHQYRAPRLAVLGVLQHVNQNPHMGITTDALVEAVEHAQGEVADG